MLCHLRILTLRFVTLSPCCLSLLNPYCNKWAVIIVEPEPFLHVCPHFSRAFLSALLDSSFFSLIFFSSLPLSHVPLNITCMLHPQFIQPQLYFLLGLPWCSCCWHVLACDAACPYISSCHLPFLCHFHAVLCFLEGLWVKRKLVVGCLWSSWIYHGRFSDLHSMRCVVDAVRPWIHLNPIRCRKEHLKGKASHACQ